MVESALPHGQPGTMPGDGAGRWIVGVDGSECSRHAALWAAAHADGRTAELQLATMWSVPVAMAMTPMSPMSPLAMTDSFEALEHSARAVVDELAHHLAPMTKVPLTHSVDQGGAAALLLETAATSSLLVVGSRGRGGFARLVLGSTSTQCATHSTAPVAVVPSTAPVGPAQSIIVAFDGSPNSTAALVWAVEFAAPGATVECVSVWDPTPISVGADQFVLPDASGLVRERYEHLFSQAMATTDRTDIEVHHRVAEGRARSELAEHAATADLLVMGARGHGAISAAVLGSVSTWLLHHAHCPMVIVPTPTTNDSALAPAGVARTDDDKED